MRHINATRLLTCRAILHEALLDAARDEESFCALLDQRTDYVDWVDAMLIAPGETGFAADGPPLSGPIFPARALLPPPSSGTPSPTGCGAANATPYCSSSSGSYTLQKR